ncbi:MAG: hypothetical protein BWK78_09485 [Thiotrichaceae bacterium IS1]|nr:MAG: hypothetical protein BWK78_09485 [Thiotrichaceae bacterium IS1]
MKKLKIYLDTSVINFLFAEDVPHLRDLTIDFFENFISLDYYDSYISNLVIAEIEATTDTTKRSQLLSALSSYPMIKHVPLESSAEITNLAQLYTQSNILPPKSYADALHIAICVVNEMDMLLTWNYRHLANVNRRQKIHLLNLTHNYLHPLQIITPLEVIDDET